MGADLQMRKINGRRPPDEKNKRAQTSRCEKLMGADPQMRKINGHRPPDEKNKWA